ncbi:F-box domain-containing protein [Mycena indigotica]|uniref:F-box domain-containing protein n=1 Tax=Mycena indigotica TaxID=2126181 RepID=A0A8H6SHJ1_9AGAR|nr:F-box domain-containing protein [Mycena indigotica]KAF7299464.1 F-box domain-containing protein [Mycena indigotica]
MPKRNESHSDLYSRLLFSKKLGYPLYNPCLSSDHSPARIAAGVQIGDVGVVRRDGSFDPIFNILDSTLNPTTFPDDFQPLAKLSAAQANDIAKQTAYYSNNHKVSTLEERNASLSLEANLSGTGLGLPGGANASIEFTRNSKHQAILVLPEGGSVYEHRALTALEQHARANAQVWYSFVRETLGQKINYGDLYLVTQVRKATSWRRTVGFRSEGDNKVKVGINAAAIGSAAFGLGHKHKIGQVVSEGESASILSTRSYPVKGATETSETVDVASTSSKLAPPENQTIFFSGFKIMVRPNVQGGLVGTAKDISDNKWTDVRRGASSFWSSVMEFLLSCWCLSPSEHKSNRMQTARNHPSDALNNHILDKYPDALAAVTHDCVWAEILQNGEQVPPPPYKQLVERVLQKFKIDSENGMFFTRPEDGRSLDALVQDQAHARQETESFLSSLEEAKTTRSVRTVSFSQSVLLERDRRSIGNIPHTPLESPDDEKDIRDVTNTSEDKQPMPGTYVEPDAGPPVPLKSSSIDKRRPSLSTVAPRSSSFSERSHRRASRSPTSLTPPPLTIPSVTEESNEANPSYFPAAMADSPVDDQATPEAEPDGANLAGPASEAATTHQPEATTHQPEASQARKDSKGHENSWDRLWKGRRFSSLYSK